MSKLIVTGYSSTIAKELFNIIDKTDLEIECCGRGQDADQQFDFAKFEDCKKFAEYVDKVRPDYLFLNHGYLPGKKLKEYDETMLAGALNINLVSLGIILEYIVQIPNINTVIMSSISGKAGSYDTMYAATKAGVDVLVRSHALQVQEGSRINAISPGIIEDARMTTVRKDLDVLAAKKAKTPTKNFTSSKEIAELCKLMLFTPGNMNGENINVNGGMYIG